MIKGTNIIIVGIIAVFIGFILIFIGTILQGTASKTGEVKTGGVILIGPIPIIFGNDTGSIITVVILAIILMVLAYVFFYRTLP
jgi:uncharacterized protein (TIGR00304 family)